MMIDPHVASSAGSSAGASSWRDAWLDRVSAESADSFPASDPPSWSPLRVGSPDIDPPRHVEHS
jgi:hypothetical protein